MEAKYQEIILGEPICKRLKEIYFSDISWPKCSRQIANKFTLLKKVMRKIYSDMDILEL